MSTMTHALPARRAVLADAIPGARARDAALILGGALLTALFAQLSIHVPPSPVPITGQTLAVVLVAGALGAHRGAASLLLYAVLGLFLPVYADGASGPGIVFGATGGYIVGFVLAAWVIGKLAERGMDRRTVAASVAFAGGQLIIFAIGVPWLQVATGMSWADAIHNGFTIFIVGGIIKALVAAGTITSAWRLVRRIDDAGAGR